MIPQKRELRLIESDRFPFEFLSRLAERESWRKEIHRPIYHVHKWWAKRLGSVFRGILLGCLLPEDGDLAAAFYRQHHFTDIRIFDPFMGSGTTIGEAHKLGLTALGRDINPVAVRSVRVAFGPLDRGPLEDAFQELSGGVGERIRALYRVTDDRGSPADVLYYFWVMQVACPDCRWAVDLFPSWIIARNAYPNRRPEIQILCPACGEIFSGSQRQESATCQSCGHSFNPHKGTATGARAICRRCHHPFTILDAVADGGTRPGFRLYGKLVLTQGRVKQYQRASAEDQAAYQACGERLSEEVRSGHIRLPTLALQHGFNTRQAMSYRFLTWRDFFNDRQLLALGWLHSAIAKVPDKPSREALLTLFSGVLEFNNLFASYKGEGTGAVRHMFAHHVLKPERAPIEANVWGTPKSSGAFSNLFRGRLLRALEYRQAPMEIHGTAGEVGRVCSPPFSGEVERVWPESRALSPRGIYLSCGDSSKTGLPEKSVDLVVTDPPFFDNVHYSELADFFFAWQQFTPGTDGASNTTTRASSEVQDTDADRFAEKLKGVFRECHRILKDNGLFVFTYHHSRDQGWQALAEAVLGGGFVVTNSQPVKAEMSVATPKSQAKEPIQLDIILVCRKQEALVGSQVSAPQEALASARAKLTRLREAGFRLSRNDCRIVLFGQLLVTLQSVEDSTQIARRVEEELEHLQEEKPVVPRGDQLTLFE